ncbi:hypothetical protein KFL_008320010 [Klebsormidium nitens]|uniref:Uncharacterized protein n=1 Tax=Klebsormidium nitens TaxID=105231 RepID=A0A1Y1INI5_KLENI|nr:hypothetical protein KFL_008320010 [Klebsormidium nitens]|eukprot:GAQ91672.1 hypothetical protein KFL_008320010 [Klebsormidium nitens]
MAKRQTVTMANGTALPQLAALALAVLTSFWMLNGVAQPALAHRTLKPSSGHVGDFETDNMGNPVNHYACGFYDNTDLRDAGLAHQPCYGVDGSIQFCCLSGSSKCSCPAAAGYNVGCFNYEDGNSLNANTGEECGYFLPEEASTRRGLADSVCVCPSNDLCTRTFDQSYNANTLRCQPSGTNGSPQRCEYDKYTGVIQANKTCCPYTASC